MPVPELTAGDDRVNSAPVSEAPTSSPNPNSGSGLAPTAPVLEAAGPVLQDVADAVVEAPTVQAFLVDDAVAQLNSDGDQVYMRVTGEAKVEAEIGVKGQHGGELTISQNGEGDDATYTVAVEKHALLALTGKVPIPNLPLKGEIGVQTFDTVEMTFDSPEEAARAAQIVQRLAAADAIDDAASATGVSAASGAPGNPVANPLNESGAPNDVLLDAVGVTQDDLDFLQDNVSAYEQTLTGRGRLAVEAKLPQLVSAFEAAGEARLDGRRLVTRRVELPTDTEDGSLTYSIGQDVRLSAKEKATIGPNVANQLTVGAQFQNRVELATGSVEVSATWDIPAGTDVAESPVGGRAIPEANLIAEGELGVPDRVAAQMTTEWRDEELLTLSRGDTNRVTTTLAIDDPANVPAAIGAFVQGDPQEAARLADASLTGELESIERTGIAVQVGGKAQLVEGVKADASVIVEGGIDDVVGTRSFTIDGRPDLVQPPADAPAGPDVPDAALVVVPRNGLTLRDAPDGERQSVFQNGTFLEPTGDAVTGPDGAAWIPVRGTDLNDQPVEGYVAAEYVQPHDPLMGQMDGTGRTNPSLEHERYQEIQVQDGDNLWDLAAREGVDFNEMVALNEKHLISPDLIFEGDTVYIPGTAQGPLPAPEPEPVEAPSVVSGGGGETRVDGSGSIPTTDSPLAPTPIPPFVSPSGQPFNPADSIPAESIPSPETAVASPADSLPGGYTPPAPSAPVADPLPDVGPAPDTTGRPPLDEILTEYQVDAVDPEDMTTWRPDLAPPLDRFTIGVTDVEAGLLDELGTFDEIGWANMARNTNNDALERFPMPDDWPGQNLLTWNNNGHTDAYRHALWNARMSQSFGEDWTAAYATAHEMVPGNEAAREAMDLYNNEVGRQIARDNPDASDAELQQLVADALENGELLVVDQNGDLAWSDQVAYGEHGQPRRIFLDGNDVMLEENLEQGGPDS